MSARRWSDVVYVWQSVTSARISRRSGRRPMIIPAGFDGGSSLGWAPVANSYPCPPWSSIPDAVTQRESCNETRWPLSHDLNDIPPWNDVDRKSTTVEVGWVVTVRRPNPSTTVGDTSSPWPRPRPTRTQWRDDDGRSRASSIIPLARPGVTISEVGLHLRVGTLVATIDLFSLRKLVPQFLWFGCFVVS